MVSKHDPKSASEIARIVAAAMKNGARKGAETARKMDAAKSSARPAAFADAAERVVVIDNSADGEGDHLGGLLAEKSPAGAWTIYADIAAAPLEIGQYLAERAI